MYTPSCTNPPHFLPPSLRISLSVCRPSARYSIDQWHKTSPTCPICKVGLPRRRSQLLKLFFSAGNPSPRADEDHRLSCSTTAAASGGAEVETGDGGEADSREGQHLSPADARALRSELACARRVRNTCQRRSIREMGGRFRAFCPLLFLCICQLTDAVVYKLIL